MTLFIELLQIALGNRDTLSRIPEREEWTSLLVEAKKQTVVSLLLRGLERLSPSQRPPQEVLLRWIGTGQMEAEAYTLQCKRARELTQRLTAASYKSCVLKGVGLSQLYPTPEHRIGGDIDLWVEGNRKEIMTWLNQQCVVNHVLWHHVDAKFFEDIPTEIHFHPCWLYNPFYNKRLQRWFDACKESQMQVDENLGFVYPTVQFNAVYSLVHFYHHLIEEGIGFRHIVDYYYIVKALPVDERSSVLAELKSFGMYKVMAAMMWVLQVACGLSSAYLLCESDEKEGRFLQDEIMRGGNFGHYRKDSRSRNSTSRMFALLPHYPKEVLWIVPWKLWHKGWRFIHR